MKIDYRDPVSDVLTTVLNALQFQGKVFCYTKLTAPWALRLKRKDYVHFHFFERGQGWVELEETGAETAVADGDLVIVPHGVPHILRDNPKSKAVYVEDLLPCRDAYSVHGGGAQRPRRSVGRLLSRTKLESHPASPAGPYPCPREDTWRAVAGANASVFIA
jgi:hypothetical protein